MRIRPQPWDVYGTLVLVQVIRDYTLKLRLLTIVLSICLLASSLPYSFTRCNASVSQANSVAPCCCGPGACRMAKCPGGGAHGLGIASCSSGHCRAPVSSSTSPNRSFVDLMTPVRISILLPADTHARFTPVQHTLRQLSVAPPHRPPRVD